MILEAIMGTVGMLTAFVSQENCQALSESTISRHSAAVRLAQDRRSRFRELSALNQYWRGACQSDKSNSSRNVVRDLSRLFVYPEARLHIARMLIYSGPNLAYAREELNGALVDQIDIEARQARASRYLIPSTGNTVSMALKCLLRKIDTGEIDRDMCLFVD